MKCIATNIKEVLDKSHNGMFGERKTLDECLEYACKLFPDATPQVLTAIFVYHNTYINILRDVLLSEEEDANNQEN